MKSLLEAVERLQAAEGETEISPPQWKREEVDWMSTECRRFRRFGSPFVAIHDFCEAVYRLTPGGEDCRSQAEVRKQLVTAAMELGRAAMAA